MSPCISTVLSVQCMGACLNLKSLCRKAKVSQQDGSLAEPYIAVYSNSLQDGLLSVIFTVSP